MNELFYKLTRKQDLEKADVEFLSNSLKNGSLDEFSRGSILMRYLMKIPSHVDFVGFLNNIMESMPSIEFDKDQNVVFCCGTGSEILEFYPVTTASAIVAAAGGAKVIKHSSHIFSESKSSAPFLKELGINFSPTFEQTKDLVNKTNLAFLFGVVDHQLLKFFSLQTQKFSFNDVYVILSMLSSPFKNVRYSVGTYSEEVAELLAKVFESRRDKALVYYGHGGLDSFSLIGKTLVYEVEWGGKRKYVKVPEDFLVKHVDITAFPRGSPKENALAFKEILKGAKGPLADLIILNAGMFLFNGAKVSNLQEGYRLARDLVSSGKVKSFLEEYLAKTEEMGFK